MKKLFLLLSVIVLCAGKSLAVEQIPDILLIDKDTVYLKSFPLEDLKLKYHPFEYGAGMSYPDASCLRGYQATWVVIDYKLLLKSITKIGDPEQSINLESYFAQNNYDAEFRDGMVFAKWYSAAMVYYFSNSTDFVHKPGVRFPWDKVKLKFESGLMTKNILNETK